MKAIIRLIILTCVMVWGNLALAVDINTADAKTMASELPGIGAVKAAAIVEYRKKHGRFTSVEQLSQVNGIGDKTVAKIRPLVSLKGSAFGTKTKPAKSSKAKASKAQAKKNTKAKATTKKTKAQKNTSKTKSSAAKTKSKTSTKSKKKSKTK